METWKKWTIWGGLYGLISQVIGITLAFQASERGLYNVPQYNLFNAILFFPFFLPLFTDNFLLMIILPIPIGALIGYMIGDYLEHKRK